MKRATPLFDVWREQAKSILAEHGRKADLAHHLAATYGRPARSWQFDLQRFLSGERMPGAEVFMAIDQWLTALSLAKDGRKVARGRK